MVRLLAEVGRHVVDTVVKVILFEVRLSLLNNVGQVRLEDVHVLLHALVDGLERGYKLEAGRADDGADESFHRESLDVLDHLQHLIVVVIETSAAHDAPDDVQRRQFEETVHLD